MWTNGKRTNENRLNQGPGVGVDIIVLLRLSIPCLVLPCLPQEIPKHNTPGPCLVRVS